MTTITSAQVKELRERTSVGMMECKKALEEANGDMEAAIKILRERGNVKAAKREGRVASEGLVGTAIAGDYSVAVAAQLNCETDFVARNEEFAALARDAAQSALAQNNKDLESLANVSLPSGSTVASALEEIRTKIGEKIEFGSFDRLEGDVTSAYIHPPGKIGVLISASFTGDASKKAQISEGLREIAMHIAAFSPRFLNEDQVDTSTLDAEREIYAAMARNEGKPEQIIPKIVDGKVKAFYRENCLVHQMFAKDTSKTVQQVAADLGKSAGGELKLTGFVRIQIGGQG